MITNSYAAVTQWEIGFKNEPIANLSGSFMWELMQIDQAQLVNEDVGEKIAAAFGLFTATGV